MAAGGMSGGLERAQKEGTMILTLEFELVRILWVASDRILIHISLKQKIKFSDVAEKTTCPGNSQNWR